MGYSFVGLLFGLLRDRIVFYVCDARRYDLTKNLWVNFQLLSKPPAVNGVLT